MLLADAVQELFVVLCLCFVEAANAAELRFNSSFPNLEKSRRLPATLHI